MKLKRIEHVAIAVKDLDATRRMLEGTLGLTLESEEDLSPHGARLAMFPVGETYLELIEPTRAGTRTDQWIAAHGEGLYHLCFEVDDIDAALAEMKTRGVLLLDETPRTGHGGARIAFLDPRSTGGVLVELMQPAGRS